MSFEYAGGAFKTMPVSPKDGKPVLSCDSVPMEPDAAKMQNKAESSSSSSSHQTPPTIFTFNTLPTSSKLMISHTHQSQCLIKKIVFSHEQLQRAQPIAKTWSTRITVCTLRTKVIPPNQFISIMNHHYHHQHHHHSHIDSRKHMHPKITPHLDSFIVCVLLAYVLTIFIFFFVSKNLFRTCLTNSHVISSAYNKPNQKKKTILTNICV